MSHEPEADTAYNLKQLKTINFGTDLAEDLWITICNYLEPFERFRLCRCCRDLNNLLCTSQYPFYSFYKSDINYWINNIECSNVVKIKTKRSKNLPKYAFNFYDFDSISLNILLSIKYYIIFYHRISGISVNKKIEKIQHLLQLQYASEHIMARLSDDEYYDGSSIFDINNISIGNNKQDEEDKIISQQLKQLDIDINTETNYLPSTIIHIYMHEISNRNQFLMHWICDILCKCDSNCNIFRDTHFDKSNLNNESINYICNALENRNKPFMKLRNLFFSGNVGINDECIERLLNVLYKQCPGLTYLNLDRTGITNKTCHIIHRFYTKFLLLNENDKNGIIHSNKLLVDSNKLGDKIPKFEYIDLSNNDGIDINGIDIINDMFIKYTQFNMKYNLLNRNPIKLNLDIDVSNCNWSIARVTWSNHILYDD
eukprot:230025_1